MKTTFFTLGTILTIALLISFTFEDQKLSDLPPKSSENSISVQNDYSSNSNGTDASGSYWLNRAPMPQARDLGSGVGYSRNDTGWVYILGGESASNSLYRYNMRTNSWSTMANIPLGKDRLGSAIIGDSIYSIGGSTVDPNYTNDFYKYDIKTNTWVTRASLPSSLGWCKGQGYQDSLVYVAGGFNGTATLAQVLLYNSKTNTWRTATPMPGLRFGGGFAVKGDTLLYVSGVDGAALVNTVYRGVISQSDRSVITWTTGSPLPTPLTTGQFRFDAHTWGNNGIIITGGSTAVPFTSVSNACMSYSPGANVWTVLPNKLTAWTAGQSGVAFSNGALKLLCTGGFNGTVSTTVSELYSDTLALVGIANPVNNTIPAAFKLNQNFPNPFNPVTTINFSLPKNSTISLKIYDVLGKELMTLVNESKPAGNYSVSFDATSLSSGVYFYRLEADNFSDIKRMTLIK